MDPKGDIPEKSEVQPSSDSVSKITLIHEVLEKGGEIHVYLPNQSPGEDIHLKPFRTHVWPGAREGRGLVYTMVGDEEHWIFPEEITHVERHYDD